MKEINELKDYWKTFYEKELIIEYTIIGKSLSNHVHFSYHKICDTCQNIKFEMSVNYEILYESQIVAEDNSSYGCI